MFKKLLEKCGAKVTVAQNGKEALQSVADMDKENPFQVIFMDIQMPVMNGYEATEKIRALPCKIANNIPIIAVTANAFQDDINKSRKAGMNGHLAKPVNMNELRQLLNDLGIIC